MGIECIGALQDLMLTSQLTYLPESIKHILHDILPLTCKCDIVEQEIGLRGICLHECVSGI